ncbi:hypothetical protein A7317_29075 [Pseudomonas fluorescens]|uniref:ORC-CDC6 family AAA ATPase n=1 Tax=Pseudomonas TaxID=286 RepID=UPI00083CECFB|nr:MULTISPECIES: hypothetical protein [Pseudomonas]AOE70916.1 hypothetical protein A7317_29075 [Pseudomonas fluorescens]AOE76692.1 hypothetical protein A7319_28850 [Pseudomonas fluorescens]RMP31112.1 hypothetical protein ALQ25_200168 [Pseudomonas coronafaciens pv. atropurpurea]
MPALADAFLKNRADNLPPDVFQEFIVPPFFQHISIFQDKKSVRILGGRGCGKTMFLKFLCHGSTFSGHRENISDEVFSNLGLYFRPDTGFCSLMTSEWLQGQKDGHAFSHYLTLSLVAEICEAIKTIDAAKNLANGPLSVGSARLGATLVSQLGLPEPSIAALHQRIEQSMAEFDLWVRNPDHCQVPQFVHFSVILTALAKDLAKYSPRLESIAFRVFVDEFENLLPRHREIVCDAIKHPSQRIAVHIAHKRDAVTDLKTSGVERIAEIHDIRTIDLESYLARDSDFDVLAAELFLFRIYQADGVISCPAFRPELLHDPKHLTYRLTEEYRQDVVNCVKQILPELSAPEIARMALQDQSLRQRVGKMIKKGLEFQGLDRTVEVDDLINENVPEATVVLGAILNRKTQSGKDALGLFQKLLVNGRSKTDPFHKQGGWVDNNLYGCLFHLYAGLPRRPNILYSGFSRFCKITAPNLRFFQELCHNTLLLGYQRKSANDIGEPLRVDYDTQATAVKQVSDAMFGDIMQLGPQGYRLLEFARRLGGLFEAYNRRRSQSEPEINHFSINEADTSGLSADAQTILREAKIWSVLRETKDTKNKAEVDTAQFELVLNAIYAPHFRISYRKRRKITLTAAELDIILSQSDSNFETLVKQLVDSQDDDITAQITGSLF